MCARIQGAITVCQNTECHNPEHDRVNEKEVHVLCENCALLGYYATSSGNLLVPTFRDNLSVPSSGVKR